jgi:hypothetical protein
LAGGAGGVSAHPDGEGLEERPGAGGVDVDRIGDCEPLGERCRPVSDVVVDASQRRVAVDERDEDGHGGGVGGAGMTAAQQVGEDGVGVDAGDGATPRAGGPSPDVSASSFLRRIESPDGIAPLHSYIDPREAWMAQKSVSWRRRADLEPGLSLPPTSTSAG